MPDEEKGKSTAQNSSDRVHGLVNELVGLVQASLFTKGSSVAQHSLLKETVVGDTLAAAVSSPSSSSSKPIQNNQALSFRRRTREPLNSNGLQQEYLQYQRLNNDDPPLHQGDGLDVVNYLDMVDYTDAVYSMDARCRARDVIQSFADSDDIVAYLNDSSTQYTVDVWGMIPSAFAQQLREAREQVQTGDRDGSAVTRLRQIQRQLKSRL